MELHGEQAGKKFARNNDTLKAEVSTFLYDRQATKEDVMLYEKALEDCRTPSDQASGQTVQRFNQSIQQRIIQKTFRSHDKIRETSKEAEERGE